MTEHNHSFTDNKPEQAVACYLKGCNCAQAVISAWTRELGLPEDTALRMFEGFGGGIGGRKETCGAFSAACAVLSYFKSTGDQTGLEREETFRVIQEAASRYETCFGSLICREILKDQPSRPHCCPDKVKAASEIILDLLKAEKLI